jgi:hypothetical protein
MTRITKTLQLNDRLDADILKFLEGLPTGEGQAILKQLVRWGIERYRNNGGTLPPVTQPDPTGGMSAYNRDLERVMFRAVYRALKKCQVAVPGSVPMNSANHKDKGRKSPKPEPAEEQSTSSEILPSTEDELKVAGDRFKNAFG